jgi:hypothetical protein
MGDKYFWRKLNAKVLMAFANFFAALFLFQIANPLANRAIEINQKLIKELEADTKRLESLLKKPEKTRRPKRVPLKMCLQSDKVCYTRELAESRRIALEKKTLHQYLRIYCCQFCNAWHLTHHKRNKF